MVSGKVLKVNPILANGRITKQKVLVYMFGQMETNTKENGKDVFVMAMALISLQMVIYTLVNIKKVTQMDLVSTDGKMVIAIQDNSEMD